MPKTEQLLRRIDELEKQTGVRRTIARNMFNSLQTTAQNTCTCKVDVTELLALRQRLVDEQEELGCRITVNDLLCKMLGKVLPKHPLANATFDGILS